MSSKCKCVLRRLILNILNFRANSLSNIFKILHALPNSGSSSAVTFIVELVGISFERCYEVFELLKFLHCIKC